MDNYLSFDNKMGPRNHSIAKLEALCDPILENGAYCAIYEFELELSKDEKVTLSKFILLYKHVL